MCDVEKIILMLSEALAANTFPHGNRKRLAKGQRVVCK